MGALDLPTFGICTRAFVLNAQSTRAFMLNAHRASSSATARLHVLLRGTHGFRVLWLSLFYTPSLRLQRCPQAMQKVCVCVCVCMCVYLVLRVWPLRYFAVGKWASTLARVDDEEPHLDILWQSFVVRLWTPECTKRATSVNVQLPCLQKDLRKGLISRDIVNLFSNSAGAGTVRMACSRKSHVWCRLRTADDRLPKQALQGGKPELQELLWYVKKAVEQLAAEQVVLFTFMPTTTPPDLGGREKALRLKEGVNIKVGAHLKLPALSTMTADPTVVWRLCQDKVGVVFKVTSKKAKPSWPHSICAEEPRGNHLSNTACLTLVFFKRGESM